MADNTLILRNTLSPYGDIVKSSVLSFTELDTNFIKLKGMALYSAQTINDTVKLINYNGDIINVDISDKFWGSGSTGFSSIKLINNGNSDSTGNYSISVGYDTISNGDYSHASGYQTTANGEASHVEGYLTTASGDYSHAEGENSVASGQAAHAEGQTRATGICAHSEGFRTTASGDYSHSGGRVTIASGLNSFVHGSGSTASGTTTIVLGSNIVGNLSNTVYVNDLIVKKSMTIPTNSSDTIGEAGMITWDNTYIYWKTNTGWLRVSGSTF